MEDLLHTFNYIKGFVVMNNQDPINGLKSVPFSPDADQAMNGMSSNMLLIATAASNVLYYLEATVGYNLVDVGPATLISIRGLHAKLWAPKVVGVLVVEISRLPLESVGTKWHLGAGPVAKHKVYYKGESGDFPRVWAVVSLVSPSLPVARPSTKSALAMH